MEDAGLQREAEARAEALARALRRGARGALERWYALEHPLIWRLCLGLAADPAAADDLAQNAMLHLVERIESWNPRRPWAAWRNRVVRNLCLDAARRRAASARAERAAATEAAPRARRGAIDPLAEAARGELRERVAAALRRLSPREREAFVLRELEERPTAEVAAVLEVTESTVRSLVTLARRRLRGLLAEDDPRAVSFRAGIDAPEEATDGS